MSDDQNNQNMNVDNQTKTDNANTQIVDVDAKVQAAVDKKQRDAADADRAANVQKNAGYYSRKPDEYAELQRQIAAINPELVNPALKEIENLRLEAARDKAMRRFKLDDDDEELLTATTPEGVMKQAEKLRSKYDAIAAKNSTSNDDVDDDVVDDPPVKPPVKKSTTNRVDLPDYKPGTPDEGEFWRKQLQRISR